MSLHTSWSARSARLSEYVNPDTDALLDMALLVDPRFKTTNITAGKSGGNRRPFASSATPSLRVLSVYLLCVSAHSESQWIRSPALVEGPRGNVPKPEEFLKKASLCACHFFDMICCYSHDQAEKVHFHLFTSEKSFSGPLVECKFLWLRARFLFRVLEN